MREISILLGGEAWPMEPGFFFATELDEIGQEEAPGTGESRGFGFLIDPLSW